jgi:hypothetical protein
MNKEDLLISAFTGSRGFAKGFPAALVKVGATNPAAGSEVPATDFVVPAGKIWVPLSFSVVLAQGITQTPSPGLVWDDGTNVLGIAPGSTAPVSASTTTRMTWVRRLGVAPTAGAGLTQNIALLPDLELEPGYRVSTLTAGIGANTDYAAAVLRYYELNL